jgi:ATP-dependent Zn protease
LAFSSDTAIEEELVENTVIISGRSNMDWIYEHHIGKTWDTMVDGLNGSQEIITVVREKIS